MMWWKWKRVAKDVLEMQVQFLEVMGMVEKAIGDQGWGKIRDNWNHRRDLYMQLFQKKARRK